MRAGWWSLVATLLTLPLAARGASAQTSGYLDVDGAWVAPWEGAPNHGRALSIAPAIRRDWQRYSLSSEGAATLADPSHYYVQNLVTATRRSREWRRINFESGLLAGGLAYRGEGFRTIGAEKVPIARELFQLQARGRADVALDKWGFSLTATGGENFGGAVRQPWGVEAGMTRELGRVLLYATARADRFREYDTVLVHDVATLDSYALSATGGRAEEYRTVQPLLTMTGGGTVAMGRAELTTEFGVQQGRRMIDPARPRARKAWTELIASLAATYRIAPRILLRIGGGLYPTDYVRQLPQGKFVSVGLRLERGRRQQVDWYLPPDLPAFRIDTLPGGARAVRLRAPRALKVDISADFTDWTPVPMRRLKGGDWEAVLPIAPGTYRVSVRVDGSEWSAPPGLVGVLDEFNGEVGLVVIR
ncbi:MAG: hypothetical protein HOQ11_08350 [Gemmatimonadaceae bacterium]|nr:hypothetical protein [Gemmatimonadaceae bacterium]NUQ91807.1 hypothetical protein [Gemmatimonadaceae bacterium]NUR19061.1 hypothetical protein [Gemmatimonadaceae bacterium]NUS97404.1 hypothetical protein [Gemmatimonadaceae bacterium]